jgi:hypothetical protein
MGDYFKPWRRRIGVLTLLMALVFVALWVRGTVVTDQFCFGDSKGYRAFEVRESCLLWGNIKAFGGVTIGPASVWTVYPKDHRGSQLQAMHLTPTNERWEWRWNGFGFDFGRTRIENGGNDTRPTLWVIPHWSITILLTLVSLCLLLSKPRKSIEKKINEPISDEGQRIIGKC